MVLPVVGSTGSYLQSHVHADYLSQRRQSIESSIEKTGVSFDVVVMLQKCVS